MVNIYAKLLDSLVTSCVARFGEHGYSGVMICSEESNPRRGTVLINSTKYVQPNDIRLPLETTVLLSTNKPALRNASAKLIVHQDRVEVSFVVAMRSQRCQIDANSSTLVNSDAIWHIDIKMEDPDMMAKLLAGIDEMVRRWKEQG